MTHDSPPSPRPLRLFASALAAVPLTLCLVAGGALLLSAVSWRGSLAGALAVLATLAGGLAMLVPGGWRWTTRSGRIAWSSAGLVGLGLAVLAWHAPPGRGGDDRIAVQHVFTRPEHSFSRYALTNLVPEADQVAFAAELARLVDPRIDAAAARRIRNVSLPIYEAAAASAAFRDMGSIWAQAYGWQGHYVAVVPRGLAAGSIVFLHGSVGNFASYWHALAPLAREHHTALFFPSGGFGMWPLPAAATAVDEVIDDSRRRFGLDAVAPVLAGISNGGLAVAGAMARGTQRFRGVVLISTVLRNDLVSEGIAAGRWSGMPVLLIHGDADDRVSLTSVLREADRLEAAGARVTRVVVAGEDHFLFNARTDLVLERLPEWMNEL